MEMVSSYNMVSDRYVRNTTEEMVNVGIFQFLEFRPEAAQLAVDYFPQRKAQFPDLTTVLSAAIDHVESIEGDAYSEMDDWVGLTTDYQNRAMSPDDEDIRLTGTAKHWAIEMMKMRFEFPSSLDDLIRRRDRNRTA